MIFFVTDDFFRDCNGHLDRKVVEQSFAWYTRVSGCRLDKGLLIHYQNKILIHYKNKMSIHYKKKILEQDVDTSQEKDVDTSQEKDVDASQDVVTNEVVESSEFEPDELDSHEGRDH